MRKFGHNDDVDTAFEHLWDGGGTYGGWLTTAAAVRIKSGGNAADDQDGGANARSVTIEGLDETWTEATETINTEGADASSPTTITFIRVFRCFVASAGGYGNTNLADIEIETTGDQTVALIQATKGQTQMGLYTVPTAKTAFLLNLQVQHDNARTLGFRMFRRENADDSSVPTSALRLISEFTGVTENIMRDYPTLPSFPAMTDIITEALSDAGATSSVSVEFDLLLVDD